MSDTIFALSSGQGRSGVAVVRLSGEGVRRAFGLLCGHVPAERRATLMTIRDPAQGRVVDRGLCLFLLGPRSFTGEDMGELQVHGGRVVVSTLLQILGEISGLRAAEAGEFTRRAFVNGRLDLIEVEALGDLIAAETMQQLELAQRLIGGELSRRVEGWRRVLVSAMAQTEARIDFSDEGDVADSGAGDVAALLRAPLREIEAVLDDSRKGERIRDGVTVVIAGAPNVGKSTLLNALARREAAIVSPIAGTTRDPIEVHLDLAGVPVTLIDTAGLRDGGDELEAMGAKRSQERIARADLVMWLEALDGPVGGEHCFGKKLLKVGTKLDCIDPLASDLPALAISAVTGEGMDALIYALEEEVSALAGIGENVLVSHARQRSALRDCAWELRACIELGPSGEVELQAERLRLALRALGRLTGRVDVEQVLGEIFAGFCIGK